MSSQETYTVEVAGLKRELRLFEIKPGLKIAILNILGDTELIQACAKELAQELNCPPELMGDSAKMNMWLHKAVLARIAANGGNIPKDLMD